jgi:hypothetical protein
VVRGDSMGGGGKGRTKCRVSRLDFAGGVVSTPQAMIGWILVITRCGPLIANASP